MCRCLLLLPWPDGWLIDSPFKRCDKGSIPFRGTRNPCYGLAVSRQAWLESMQQAATIAAIEKMGKRICLHCKSELPYKKRRNKFCSHRCAASHNNSGLRRRDRRSRSGICPCGSPAKRRAIYCLTCVENRVWKQKPFEILRSDPARRRFLIRERGHYCGVCSLAEWMGKPMPVELDHIDGNPENNAKENLRLICPNCHAQTPTYKGRNIGRVLNSKRQRIMNRYVGKYR